MKRRLTDLSIRKLTYPATGQVTYWDETTPGFGLRCSQKTKSFVVMYGEKRRLKTIGRYPEIGLQEARKEARSFLSHASFHKHEVSRVTYQEAVILFLRDCETRLRPITIREYRRHLKFFDFKKDLTDIGRPDVVKKLDELRDRPSSQNYAFTTMKVFFNWAIRNQLCSYHPIAADKKPNRLSSRERVLDDQEMAILFSYTISNRGLFNDLVSLLILTGQRRSEIGGLEWSEINDGFLELSGERTKNHRSHRIPLSKTAMHIVETREGNDRFLFPSKVEGKVFNGFRRTKAYLDEVLDISHFTLHDLRRTFSSNMARLGTPIHITEKILNHTSGTFSGVAGIYNRHTYIDEMRLALEMHDRFLLKIISEQSLSSLQPISDH